MATRLAGTLTGVIVVLGAPSIQLDPDTGRGDPAGLASRIALALAVGGANVQLAGKVGDDPAGDEVLLALARAGVRHDAVLRDPDRATPLAPAVTDVPPVASVAMGALVEDEGVLAGGGKDRASPAIREPVLDPADVALCLSYLREFAVVVVAQPLDQAARSAVARAAAFAGARQVVIVPAGEPASAALPDAPPPGATPQEAASPAVEPAGAVPPDSTVLEGPLDDPDDEFARLVARYAIALERGGDAGTAFRLALAGAGWEAVTTA